MIYLKTIFNVHFRHLIFKFKLIKNVIPVSGGSGRTGTFLAICNLLDRLKLEGVVDVFQTVRGLRMQRPLMVRTLVSHNLKIM